MKFYVLLGSLFCFSINVFAQSIQNVTFRQEGGQDIWVFYDLLSGEEDLSYEVSLYWSKDGGNTFEGPLRRVEGDQGQVSPGRNKQIRWKARQEVGRIQSRAVVLRVKAEFIPPSGYVLRDLPWAPEMVLVKGGTFLMGSPEAEGGREEGENQHSVRLDDYYIGKYEVTMADFERFVREADYQTDAEKKGGSYFWNGKGWANKEGITWRHDAKGKLRPRADYQHPVIHVNWNDAVAYCHWLSKQTGQSYRLPTEAEWEYAARSEGEPTLYSWGNGAPQGKKGGNVADEDGANIMNWNKYANNIFQGYKDGHPAVAPVGQFLPNQLGVNDMSGNVWEWCQDWYDEDYYETCKEQGVVENPLGASSGTYRVVRGGSWYSGPRDCRVAYRLGYAPPFRHTNLGFRLSRSSRP